MKHGCLAFALIPLPTQENANPLCCNAGMEILILRAVPAKTRTTASWPRRLPKSPPARVPRPHCWSWRTTTFRSTTPIWKPGHAPDVIRFKQALHSHAAWIICCPEYNGSYPALLKNALDWASSPVKGDPVWGDGVLPFRGKVVGMCSASPGGLGGLRAQSHLAPLLLNLECWLAPRSHAVSRAADAFDAQGKLMHPQDQQGVQAVLSQVLWAAQRLHA